MQKHKHLKAKQLRLQPPTPIFFLCRLEDLPNRFRFEQLSSAINGGAMAMLRQPKTFGFRPISRKDYIIHWLSRC